MWRISSVGTTDPPPLTVRSEVRSRRDRSGCSIMASSMVGTPQVNVALSDSISSSTRPGSNDSSRTAVARCWQIWNETTWPPT